MSFLGECNGYRISYIANASTRKIHYSVERNGCCEATATITLDGWSFEYNRNNLSAKDATAVREFIFRHPPYRLL